MADSDEVKVTFGEPHNRLTRMCDAMATTLDEHPENPEKNVKAIILVNDEENNGIVMHGYDEAGDAMVDLLLHMKAIFAANGKRVMFAPIHEG